MLVIGRIDRLAVLIDERLRPPFAAAGLANGDFDLLAALRRQGPPYEASPGELAVAMLVTTGATTKRIDRLERQGYVTRRPSGSTDGAASSPSPPAAGASSTTCSACTSPTRRAILAPLVAAQRDQLAAPARRAGSPWRVPVRCAV